MISMRARIGRARRRLLGDPEALMAEFEHVRFAVGAHHAVHARSARSMREAEFRAFSQFGEDGIIQWLIERVPIDRTVFVELGAGSYRESNTRFLLEHDNWRGLAIDSDDDHIRYLERTGLAWRQGITGRAAFITRENVNELLTGEAGEIGLLSIDLDGMDYWILEAIRVVTPRIVVLEYNGLWGNTRAVSVPYDAAFARATAHWTWLYYGASLPAFCHLMGGRGYRFVGSNTTGHNAFFVRGDVAGDLPDLTAEEGWIEARFRDSRAQDGTLSYVDRRDDRLAPIGGLPLVDVISGEGLQVADLR